MLTSLTATEGASLLIAVVQVAAALVWTLGACFVAEERAAMGRWAAYAALSASTWVVLSLNMNSPPLLGVLAGMCAAIALRRGIQIFVGRLSTTRFDAAQRWRRAFAAAWGRSEETQRVRAPGHGERSIGWRH